jgi:hypothetical protein
MDCWSDGVVMVPLLLQYFILGVLIHVIRVTRG